MPGLAMKDLFFTGASAEEAWPLVRDFHYSRRMPSAIQHIYAFREAGGLFGDFGEVQAAVIFSIPPTRWTIPVLELSRLVRRDDFSLSLSSLISKSIKALKANGHDLVVSFADWTQKHHGGIYQACSWNYHGKRAPACDGVLIDGTFVPGRSCNSIYGTRSPDKLRTILGRDVEPNFDEGKFLYWKPLSKAGKRKADELGLEANPYPKGDMAKNRIKQDAGMFAELD